jgi:hypothetical protein
MVRNALPNDQINLSQRSVPKANERGRVQENKATRRNECLKAAGIKICQPVQTREYKKPETAALLPATTGHYPTEKH